MFKFFHSESKTIIGAAAIIGVFSFTSRFVGFVRDRILAGEFGAGDTLDVYYAAFKIPDFMFSLVVVGALSASFIPLFSKRYFSHKQEKAWEFTNNILNLTVVVLLIFCGLIAIFAVPIATAIAPGFSTEKQQAVAQFMRIMLLAQVLLGVSTVFGSALQSLRRFFLYALAPIFYNVGIIVGAVWFVDLFGSIGLAWGVVFGAFLHTLIQLIGCLSLGYGYRPSFDVTSKDVRTVMIMTGPRVLGIAVNQLLFLILTVLASSMAVGSVTILQFAYNIQFFPVGIIGVSLAVAVFPTFAEYLANNKIDKFRHSFSVTIRQTLFFLIPMTILFLILRAQIVRVVLGAGTFDWPSTILTADTLAFFALTFIPQSFVYILARAFFALHDTATPLTAGLVGSFCGLLSAFLFRDSYGVAGLAAAYSLCAIVNLILLWIPLRKRIGTLDEFAIFFSFGKLMIAGILCGITAQFLKPMLSSIFPLETFQGVLLQGSLAGIGGLVVYLLVAWMLKSSELNAFITSLQRKILQHSQPTEAVTVRE